MIARLIKRAPKLDMQMAASEVQTEYYINFVTCSATSGSYVNQSCYSGLVTKRLNHSTQVAHANPHHPVTAKLKGKVSIFSDCGVINL